MSKKIKTMICVELGIIFLVLIIYIFQATNLINLVPECIVNKIFHILCPSCGGTRSVISFLRLDFINSFYYHPIFFFTMIYLIILNFVFIINSFRKKEILKFLYPTTKLWLIYVFIILIFTFLRNL